MTRANLVNKIINNSIDEGDFAGEFSRLGNKLCPARDELIEEFSMFNGGITAEDCKTQPEKLDLMKESLSDNGFEFEGNTFKEVFNNYCDARINSLILTELTPLGIEEAWKNDEINKGNPNLLVTKADLYSQYNYSSEDSLINTQSIPFRNVEPVTKDELKSKLDYAVKQNPSSVSALIVGVGTEHTAIIAIDPLSKKYRYVDSKGQAMDPALDDKLKTLLPDYQDITDKEQVHVQQHDTSTSSYWILKNMQTIAKNGIEAEMSSGSIDGFGLKVQEVLVDKVILDIKLQKTGKELNQSSQYLESSIQVQQVSNHSENVNLNFKNKIVSGKNTGIVK